MRGSESSSRMALSFSYTLLINYFLIESDKILGNTLHRMLLKQTEIFILIDVNAW